MNNIFYSAWCEKHVGGLITEPANAWSSFGLTFLGLYLFLKNNNDPFIFKLFSVFIFINGLITFFYHAFMAWPFTVIDIYFNNLLAVIVLFIILGHHAVSQKIKIIIAIAHFFIATVINIFLPEFIGIYLLLVTTLGMSILEIKFWGIMKKKNVKWNQSSMNIFISIAILALVTWGLDYSKVLCFPTNHLFQMHAIWHLLMAAALYFLYRHFKQFEIKV